MIARRSFLAGILAAGCAPAIVRASSLMPVRAPRLSSPGAGLLTLWGDGVHEDSAALRALLSGQSVYDAIRESVVEPAGQYIVLRGGHYRLDHQVVADGGGRSYFISDCRFDFSRMNNTGQPKIVFNDTPVDLGGHHPNDDGWVIDIAAGPA